MESTSSMDHTFTPLRKMLVMIAALVLPAASVKADDFQISRQGNQWQLLCNDVPFYIKGAVGWKHFETLREYGGNAIRSRARKDMLDRAHTCGLKVMAGLPVHGERNAMDWGDDQQVSTQRQKVVETVKQLKDHPALMLWVIGNELDWIPPGRPHHAALWRRLNDLAIAIHEVDPNHPVLTVVGTGRFEQKIHQIAKELTDIDLLGINAYGDLAQVCALTRSHWPKPYVVAEWGPTGHWQVPKTKWRVPLEQTSSQKAAVIRERYRNVIMADRDYCLGSFVFLWGEKQETTHTWYGMYHNDLQTESIDMMKYLWTGAWPSNRAPSIKQLRIIGSAAKPIYVAPSQTQRAVVDCVDPDNDTLEYRWDIRPEVEIPDDSYAGNMEKSARPIVGLITGGESHEVEFRTPQRPGPYRLFVTVTDSQGHIAYSNLPFFVRAE
jgi:hypothetical protein